VRVTVLVLALLTAPHHARAQNTAQVTAPIAHTYRTVGGRALRAYAFSPVRTATAMPAVLLFHGGGWTAGEAAWLFATARQFAANGFVAISIEYRLATDSVTPREQGDDACAAFRWLRQQARAFAINPHHVAAYGVSAGGQIVGLLATLGCSAPAGLSARGGPDALVLLSPALDLSDDSDFVHLLHGRGSTLDFSPVAQQRGRVVPTFIVHGVQDSLTPVAGVQRFCQAQRTFGGRCTLQLFQGVGHLLTRNLAHQETVLDPDSTMRAAGLAMQVDFLRGLWGRHPRRPGR
jgi:acetyl esterase